MDGRTVAPYRTAPAQERLPPRVVEREYFMAVLRGDLPRAAELFVAIRRPTRRMPVMPGHDGIPNGVRFQYRGDAFDRFLSRFGFEGLKGPWVVLLEEQIICCGFDDEIVYETSGKAQRVLRRLGLLYKQ